MNLRCLRLVLGVACTAVALVAPWAFTQNHTTMSAPGTQPASQPVTAAQEVAVYHVSPAGDDSGPGTADRPYATIQKAASIARGRDVVKIAAGVYHERVALTRSGNYFGRTIRFEGEGPDKTIIDATNLPGWSRGIFDTAGQDYLEIVGIGVRNGKGAGFSIFSSWQVSLENCRSFNTTDSGMKIDKSGMVKVSNCEIEQACWHGGEESLSVKRCQDVQILGCHIHDTGHEGIDIKEGSKHVRVIGCHIERTERQGLYAEAWDSATFDIRFENNRVHDCQFGIAAGSECGGLLSDVWFVNNLVYNNHGPGMIMADWGDAKFTHPVKQIHFLRNTVANNGTERWGGGMVFENTDVTDSEISHNILSQNTHGQLFVSRQKLPAGVTINANIIDGISDTLGDNMIAALRFADPDHGDFTIVTGPKNLDAGADVAAVERHNNSK